MVQSSFYKDLFTSSTIPYSFLDSPFHKEYFKLFIYLIFAILLGIILLFLSSFLVTQQPETEKLSTYECGFEPYGDSRNKFNVKFYLVAVLFILFDIEIIFVLPWCLSISQIDLFGFWCVVEFLLELCIGFIYVWAVGALEWD